MIYISFDSNTLNWALKLISINERSEASALDKILTILSDGNSHHIEELGEEDEALKKRINKLLRDNYIYKVIPYSYTDEYSITSDGKLYFQLGGYRKEILYKKVQRLQVWFSIVTFIIALWGFIRTF